MPLHVTGGRLSDHSDFLVAVSDLQGNGHQDFFYENRLVIPVADSLQHAYENDNDDDNDDKTSVSTTVRKRVATVIVFMLHSFVTSIRLNFVRLKEFFESHLPPTLTLVHLHKDALIPLQPYDACAGKQIPIPYCKISNKSLLLTDF